MRRYPSSRIGFFIGVLCIMCGGARVAFALPEIHITTSWQTVSHDVTAFSVAGSSVDLVEGMWVSNSANAVVSNFPAAEWWTAPAVGLEFGYNWIYVYGSNVVDYTTNHRVRITRDNAAPVPSITTAISVVEYEVSSIALAGTNNQYVTGGMWVSNAANSVVSNFPASASWTAPALGLEVGQNTLHVYGSNIYGTVNDDTIAITRHSSGSTPPSVDVTTTPVTVTYDVTSYTVAGTNSHSVFGGMWISNSANGTVESFASSTAWTAPAMDLLVGTNAFTVYGSNLVGDVASDSVEIMRSESGSGAPFVDVTSTFAIVIFSVTNYAIAGTNNVNVVGGMSVSNGTSGAESSFPASPSWTTYVELLVGTNHIHVSGTNVFGAASSDSVDISRLDSGSVQPDVTITSAPAYVHYEVTAYAVAGKNNQHVVGYMRVSNFPASSSWTTPTLGLEVGLNEMSVYGTNAYGAADQDTVNITRHNTGSSAPVVGVTTTPATVTYDVTTYVIAGTNNYSVFGGMWVSNEANGVVVNFAALTGWQTPALSLPVGTNVFTVRGTNLSADVASDSVTIVRGKAGTGVPFVDITNRDVWVGASLADFSVLGTNNANVVGWMSVSNTANGIVSNFPAASSWAASPVPLAPITNVFFVSGTNMHGAISSDSVEIYRQVSGTQTPPAIEWPIDVAAGSSSNTQSSVNDIPIIGTKDTNTLVGVENQYGGWITNGVQQALQGETWTNQVFVPSGVSTTFTYKAVYDDRLKISTNSTALTIFVPEPALWGVCLIGALARRHFSNSGA